MKYVRYCPKCAQLVGDVPSDTAFFIAVRCPVCGFSGCTIGVDRGYTIGVDWAQPALVQDGTDEKQPEEEKGDDDVRNTVGLLAMAGAFTLSRKLGTDPLHGKTFRALATLLLDAGRGLSKEATTWFDKFVEDADSSDV